MTMKNKKVNKNLEKVQQLIILILQTIDLNFAKCNQIVSTSMLPTVDKYNEALRVVWNNYKLCWLFVFIYIYICIYIISTYLYFIIYFYLLL